MGQVRLDDDRQLIIYTTMSWQNVQSQTTEILNFKYLPLCDQSLASTKVSVLQLSKENFVPQRTIQRGHSVINWKADSLCGAERQLDTRPSLNLNQILKIVKPVNWIKSVAELLLVDVDPALPRKRKESKMAIKASWMKSKRKSSRVTNLKQK